MKYPLLSLLAALCVASCINTRELEKQSLASPRTPVFFSAMGEVYKLKAKGKLPNVSANDRIGVSMPLVEVAPEKGRKETLKKAYSELATEYRYPLVLNLEVKDLRTGDSLVVVLRRKKKDAVWETVRITPASKREH